MNGKKAKKLRRVAKQFNLAHEGYKRMKRAYKASMRG